jgi:nitroreductase
MIKHAQPHHPTQELIKRRWSPYGFADRPVPAAELRSLFEAARWAPSSYNEQPWRFIVATREEPEAFARLLSCLVELNQAWARRAPVLVVTATSLKFARNGKPNRVAEHDVGLAVMNLTFEATARGLMVHQMSGILPDRVRELYKLPEDYQAVTAFVIGYAADPKDLPEELRARDTTERTRRPLPEFVFGGDWGVPAAFLED